jgi:hypothetical protein
MTGFLAAVMALPLGFGLRPKPSRMQSRVGFFITESVVAKTGSPL